MQMKRLAAYAAKTGVIALVLLVVLITGLQISAAPLDASAGSFPDSITGSPDDGVVWKKIAQGNATALYADAETGNFAFYDKNGNDTWYSIPQDLDTDRTTKGVKRTNLRSMLNVGYIDMSAKGLVATPSYVNSYSGSVSAGALKVQNIPGGERLEFTFPDQEFMVPVEITLKDDALSVRIPLMDIKESAHYSIVTIELLPYFLSAGKQAQGYMLIPQGSGALIHLNNGKGAAAQFDSMVYGRDQIIQPDTAPVKEDNITMPVYGICKDGKAMAAIITGGDSSANITAHVSSDSIGYNKVASKLNYRTIDSTVMFEKVPASRREIYRLSNALSVLKNYEVQFYPLSGQNANYVGMAKAYRQYLEKHQLLKKQKSESTLHVDLYGAIRKQASFLGIPYEKMVPLTTFEEAGKIADNLERAGIPQVDIRYIGWENSGVDNQKIPAKAKAVSCLGGNKQLKALNTSLQQKKYGLYLATDFINYTKSGNSFSSSSDSAQNIFRVRVKRIRYMLSVLVESLAVDSPYFLRTNEINRAVDTYLPRFLKQDVEGISLTNMGDMVYSDYSDSTGEREKMVNAYREVLKKMSANNIKIAVNSGNAYALAYADVVYKLPTTASGYQVFDEAVPFCQIVLRGAVPYTSPNINRETDKTIAFLKCMETGSEPLYEGYYADSSAVANTAYNDLYSSSFQDWKDTCIADYQQYLSVYKNLSGVSIAGHEKLADGVYRTTFDNGVRVTVNYNSTDYSASEGTVKGRSYLVTGENAGA